MNEEFKRNFDFSAPDWRRFSFGLNFSSICLKQFCQAYNDSIQVQKGFENIDIGVESRDLQSPMCGEKAEDSENCGLYMAKWEMWGKLSDGIEVRRNGIANTNQYYTFKEGENVIWRFIKLKVRELDEQSSHSRERIR